MTRSPITFLMLLIAAVASACNINAPDTKFTPTLERELLVTVTRQSIATATVKPPEVPTAEPTLRIAMATDTATPIPATATVTPTPTSTYFEYVVQQNDSMFYVIQLPQHGYGYEPQLAETVVALNDNIIDMNVLPVGSTILIPRPTLTATAVGASATQSTLATIGVDDSSGAILPSGAAVGCYEVESGDSIVAIAERYNTTLEVLSQLNQAVSWAGCAFTEPSGGPDCKPNIQIGQCVYVPLPTPLPSKTPTPTGNETATPTATHMAPRLLYPVEGAEIPYGPLRLLWVGTSGMNAADEYLVELIDQTANESLTRATAANDLPVPAEFAPDDGQSHVILWRVSVARADSQSYYHYVGAQGNWRIFEWKSR